MISREYFEHTLWPHTKPLQYSLISGILRLVAELCLHWNVNLLKYPRNLHGQMHCHRQPQKDSFLLEAGYSIHLSGSFTYVPRVWAAVCGVIKPAGCCNCTNPKRFSYCEHQRDSCFWVRTQDSLYFIPVNLNATNWYTFNVVQCCSPERSLPTVRSSFELRICKQVV